MSVDARGINVELLSGGVYREYINLQHGCKHPMAFPYIYPMNSYSLFGGACLLGGG